MALCEVVVLVGIRVRGAVGAKLLRDVTLRILACQRLSSEEQPLDVLRSTFGDIEGGIDPIRLRHPIAGTQCEAPGQGQCTLQPPSAIHSRRLRHDSLRSGLITNHPVTMDRISVSGPAASTATT